MLFRQRAFVRVTVVAALVLGSHAMYDSFAVIRWREAGISPATIGVLWSESVAGEVLVFLLIGATLLRVLNPTGALALAAFLWSGALGGHGSNHRSCGACIGSAAARIHLCAPPPRIHAHHDGHRTVHFGRNSAGSLRFGTAGFLAMVLLCIVAFPVIWTLHRALQAHRTSAATQGNAHLGLHAD